MKTVIENRKLRMAMVVMCLAAFWVALPFALDRKVEANVVDDVIRIGATLTGPAIAGIAPTGFAEYRVDDQGRRRVDVEGSSINLPAGTTLTVVINNAVVGQTSVSSFRTFFFRRDTNDGQSVPTITAGMPIQVLNSNTAVLSGTFGSVTPTPSPTGSPTASPTGSPTGTPSPSPTGSPTGTPSPSPSASPSPSPTGTPNVGDLFASLRGPVLNGVLPMGFAQFEIHSSRLELEIRVRQVNVPFGTQLAVVVDNTAVGTLAIVSGGEGELRLRTDRGQTVPQVVAGSTIQLNLNGTNVLSGTFAGFTSPSPTPSPTGSPTPSLGRSFEVHLLGSGMNPPVNTNARGEFKLSLNAAETQATLFGEFHNLSSNQSGARIETNNGTVTLIRNLGVVGGLNGNFPTVTFDVTPVQVQQLRSGLWSAVITSVNHANGEIRGTFRQRSGEGDFDGDGSNDFAVFRPSTGAWYAQNGDGFSASTLGSANDVIVSGDYDGDGKTDTAVFQNVNGSGIWTIRRSSDNGITAMQFGFATDIPARGDFDGDGRFDLAVFRPSTGVWYVQKSDNTGFIIVQFGLSGDRPIPMDMDGDGRDDITVFRPSDGNWYWLRSSDGQYNIVHFGADGDIPVRGDFDGDGKGDPTVFRPSTGVWYVLRSTDWGFSAVKFGVTGDVPAAGNYDTDGLTDIAVFRPSTGVWYIYRSSDGGIQVGQFGLNGDIPVVAR